MFWRRFTLIELLVAVVILLTLAVIILPSVFSAHR